MIISGLKQKCNMEDITSLFFSVQQDNPHWSSYVCLLEAIRGKGYGRKTCEFYFDDLVDRDDYSKRDREGLIQTMLDISQTADQSSAFVLLLDKK